MSDSSTSHAGAFRPEIFYPLLRALSDRPLLRTFRGLTAVYVFMLVVLPSGTMLGVNVKVICFLLLLPVAVQVSLARAQITTRSLPLLLGVPGVLLLWIFSAQLYGYDLSQGFAQYKDLFVTISTCWFASVLCIDDQDDTLFLLRCVIRAEIFTSALKVLLLIYALARGIPVSTLLDMIYRIFGVQLMSFDFESALGRIQFISDNLIPICIFAILCYRRLLSLTTSRVMLMLLLLIVSDFFSFSRYLWVFTLFAIVCGLLLGERDRSQAILLTILTTVTLLSLPYVVLIVALRFSSTVMSGSDSDRIAQVAALRIFIGDAPWFGHGLGSYTHRVIRSMAAPYSYEAQLLALLGQIGIVGVTFLTGVIALYFRRLWPNAQRRGGRRFGLLLLLLGWLAGGFFNPSIISSAASVSYAALFAMSALKDRDLNPNGIAQLGSL